MDYLELPAPPAVASLVHCFWFLRGTGHGDTPQTIVADGRIEVVLHLADPFVRIDDAGAPHRQAEALIAGQLTAPIRVAPQGTADVTGIRFRTAAASAVLRPSLAELTNRVEPLAAIAPRLARALLDAAAAHHPPHERVASLSRVIARFARREPDVLATRAVWALDRTEPLSVSALGRALGVSTRTLERRILNATGLPPGLLRRSLRFRRLMRLVGESSPSSWAAIAAQTGYFDQSHLIRDFRQFAGVPPSEFFHADSDLARAFIGTEDALV